MPTTSGPSTARTGTIAELDGLRGVAILLVLIHRFWPASGPLARFATVAELGWVGVDLFFVISGFLITGILIDTRDDPAYFKNFFARRVLRIFPLYYAYVAAVFVLLPMHEKGPYFQTPFIQESGSPLFYFLYLANVPEAFFGRDVPKLLGMLWSLAIEEQFYLSFPFLARISRRKLVYVLLAMVVFAPLVRLATALAFPANERVQYVATFCRVDVIALGCLLGVAVRSPRVIPRLRTVSHYLLIAFGLVFAAAFALKGLDRDSLFGRTLGYSIVAFTFASVVLFTVLSRGLTIVAPLRIPALMYLGKICYGLYMLHRLCAFLAGEVVERAHLAIAPDGAAMIAVEIALSAIVASVSWYAFEKPLLRFKRWFESRHHPMRAEAPKRA